MEKKKHREISSDNDTKTNQNLNSEEDVIATIHVLKNKTEVKKRVVTRQNKETKE